MEMGEPLLLVINDMMYDGKRKAFFRENASGYKTGINDGIAEILLEQGYDDYTNLPEYRRTTSGDDGGAATAVLGYCPSA